MSSPIKFFKQKKKALQHLSLQPGIVCNKGITEYFVLQDYEEFLQLIQSAPRPSFFELITESQVVVPFFDIEIYNDSPFFSLPNEIINTVKSSLSDHLQYDSATWIILQSHNEIKKSFHIVVRAYKNNKLITASVKDLKSLYENMSLSIFKGKREGRTYSIIDPCVYREGLFRTIYSSKPDESRPLVKCSTSDDFADIESFVGYVPPNTETHPLTPPAATTTPPQAALHTDPEEVCAIPDDLSTQDVDEIKRFVKNSFHHTPSKIRNVFVDRDHNCVVVALDEKYCEFVERDHRSNHQYVVIDTVSAKQKCHDSDCSDKKHNEIKLQNYPKEINEIIKRCLKVNRRELELIDKAIEECQSFINNNFGTNDIVPLQFDRDERTFRGNVSDRTLTSLLRGRCPECDVEHYISDNGYCLRCTRCQTVFPREQVIPIGENYRVLNNFWNNYSQIINNGTVNINIYNGPPGEEEFYCDVNLDESIFRNRELTTIYNQILDGHKILKISELLSRIEKNFKYTNGEWFFFDGSIWTADKESLEFKKKIVLLANQFNKIKTFYERSNEGLVKNVKSLLNKLYRPGFEEEIIKGAKMYYHDETFARNLNSKKHLVPFRNGVYDLITNEFRKTKKEDYINLTVGFDFNAKIVNPEVLKFIEQVLPNERVRHYVLKKMSECLNGDIPNTHFLMFIGDTGANGKSQLLNLMKLTMGEFGEKVEVTLLTRKRTNANEANTEKIKLMNKRFAFLSEPEDGEKINIGQLKELTGSEEVVARGLYQASVSFVMEAKLFLACNELPEIKGEDTALWRRIRVIDFPSRFVDEPKEPNEFKIDRTLPSRMREDFSWRQTFMNVLLEYFYKDVPEPDEVNVTTSTYRTENDPVMLFLDSCCEIEKYNKTKKIFCKDLWAKFLEWKIESGVETKIKHSALYNRVDKLTECDRRIKIYIDDERSQGWYGIALKNTEQSQQ